MYKSTQHQYTIRGVPSHVDASLRSLARKRGVSLNNFLLSSLEQASGVRLSDDSVNDLQRFAGRIPHDACVVQRLRKQREVSKKDWA